ncbi:bestrophin-3 [Trichonephila clavipes]|nr:bestrophin-3 [Trichonephila clavipes]
MTVTYSLNVSKARLCGFAKLLLRWRGSIYKLLYREMIIFCGLYYSLSALYRYIFTENQRTVFEKLTIYCEAFTNLIPLSFVLGFYVSIVVGRWWQQYLAIPWPDKVSMLIAAYVHGSDERGKIIRRTLARYLNLLSVLTFQSVSTSVKKRFPTLDHVEESVMSFLGKGKKADLIKLAIELGECESNGEELKIIELRTKILTNDAYKEDPEFVKCTFEGIISNRIDDENKQKEEILREFELQKIRLQNETQRVVGPQTLPQTKIELKKLLPTFNPEVDNLDLFLTLFEWQMKLLDLGEDLWVPYLICALPSDVTSLIAREPEEKCKDYSHIRGMLLQWFKLTAEKFWELFSRHRKSPNGTWKDYYFEIRAYFEGWLNELKIDSFDGLKNLMIANQMKKRCSPECK